MKASNVETGDGSLCFTVDEALVSMGFGRFQMLVLGYAGMGWVSEAMEMMLLSFVGQAVQSEWGLSSRQQSLITSVVFAGMLLGAYSWGVLSDSHGRRMGFLVTATVTAIAGFLSSFSPSYSMLLALRCLVGVGLGGGPVLSSWFLEFIPAPDRGFWMVVFSGFWTVGTVIESTVAMLVMPELGWRWLLALSSLPSSLLLIFYVFTPESPRYLYSKGRTDDALSVLRAISVANSSPLPPGSLLPSDHNFLLPRKSIATLPPSSSSSSSSFTALLSPKLFKSTLLLWVVFFGNAFAYYGLVLLTTELNTGKLRCLPTVATATENNPQSHTVNYSQILITSFAEFPGLVISAVIVDKLGRRRSMAVMFFAASAFLTPLCFRLHRGLTTVLLFGARICITSTFTVVYVYAPEVYPTSLRTTGVGVASSVGRVGGMLCPLVAVTLIHGCHRVVAVFLFGFIIFACGVCSCYFPFETMGTDLTTNVLTYHRVPDVVEHE